MSYVSRNVDNPVETQMAVAVLNHNLRNNYPENRSRDGKPVGRRRVFVQTETGLVMGIDLDRGDNAHTVKRRLQLALNVPTEESSLTYGDLVLENDLSAIRNDSPLLLTRNIMHRSSSTPCLSPTAMDLQQGDQSGPIEILGCSSHCSEMKQLVKDVVKAIKSGVDPMPVHSGLGGAYYFRNCRGESIAIVKPTDEEPFAPNNPKGFIGKALGQPGLKRSVRVGETGFREVAAYLLDYDNFANVPLTILVKITHSIFHLNGSVNCAKNKAHDRKPHITSKIASFQQFIPHDFDASDHGTSSFSVAAVHNIGILDIRILNTDRHAGNLLVRKVADGVGRFGGQMELIPIDHGLCLPESLEDPYFEWIHWPQASVPFSEDELEYIANLDPVRNSEMLRRELPMIRDASLRVLMLCTIFLKEAAAFGLCLAEIGEMMSREFTGMDEEPSELEIVCIEARRFVADRDVFFPETESGSEDDVLFDIESEGEELVLPKSPSSFHFELKGMCSRNPLSRLEETIEEEETDNDGIEQSNVEEVTCLPQSEKQPSNVLKLSASLNGLTDKGQWYQHGILNGDITDANKNNSSSGELQGGSRSAIEQLPASVSFVNLAEMREDEWDAFLEKFRELLLSAFHDWKGGLDGQRQRQRQRQRMGTSCQF